MTTCSTDYRVLSRTKKFAVGVNFLAKPRFLSWPSELSCALKSTAVSGGRKLLEKSWHIFCFSGASWEEAGRWPEKVLEQMLLSEKRALKEKSTKWSFSCGGVVPTSNGLSQLFAAAALAVDSHYLPPDQACFLCAIFSPPFNVEILSVCASPHLLTNEDFDFGFFFFF